jgi:hypothetical protein
MVVFKVLFEETDPAAQANRPNSPRNRLDQHTSKAGESTERAADHERHSQRPQSASGTDQSPLQPPQSDPTVETRRCLRRLDVDLATYPAAHPTTYRYQGQAQHAQQATQVTATGHRAQQHRARGSTRPRTPPPYPKFGVQYGGIVRNPVRGRLPHTSPAGGSTGRAAGQRSHSQGPQSAPGIGADLQLPLQSGSAIELQT